MRKTTSKIIVHCSDSEFGDVALIDRWHKERGWFGCGYHYVITNGVILPKTSYQSNNDGVLQEGRPLNDIGAHCKDHNADSVGVCLIGKHHFSAKQLYVTLPRIILILIKIYSLKPEDIYGHCEFSSKTCPNIDPKLIRNLAKGGSLL